MFIQFPRLQGFCQASNRDTRLRTSPPPGIVVRKELPDYVPTWAPPLFTSEMSGRSGSFTYLPS